MTSSCGLGVETARLASSYSCSSGVEVTILAVGGGGLCWPCRSKKDLPSSLSMSIQSLLNNACCTNFTRQVGLSYGNRKPCPAAGHYVSSHCSFYGLGVQHAIKLIYLDCSTCFFSDTGFYIMILLVKCFFSIFISNIQKVF